MLTYPKNQALGILIARLEAVGYWKRHAIKEISRVVRYPAARRRRFREAEKKSANQHIAWLRDDENRETYARIGKILTDEEMHELVHQLAGRANPTALDALEIAQLICEKRESAKPPATQIPIGTKRELLLNVNLVTPEAARTVKTATKTSKKKRGPGAPPKEEVRKRRAIVHRIIKNPSDLMDLKKRQTLFAALEIAKRVIPGDRHQSHDWLSLLDDPLRRKELQDVLETLRKDCSRI